MMSPASRAMFGMATADIRDDLAKGLREHEATQRQLWQNRTSGAGADHDADNAIQAGLETRPENLSGIAGSLGRRVPHVTATAKPAPLPVFPTELNHVGDLGFKQYLAVNGTRVGDAVRPTDIKTNKLITIVSASPGGLAHQVFVDEKGHSITRYLNARTGEPLGEVDLTTGGSWKLEDGVTRVRVDVLPADRDLDKVQILKGADVLAYLADKEGYDWDKAVHDRSPLDKARAKADFAQMNHWVDYLSGQPDQPGYDQFARQRVTGTGGRLYTNAANAGLARPDEWTQSFVDYGLGAEQMGGGSHSIMGRPSMGFGPIPEPPIPVQRTPYPRGPYLFANQFPEDKVGPPIQLYDLDRLQSPAQIGGRYNFVVTKGGKLIIGRRRNDEIGGGHIDLANGKPVLAAGRVKIVGGRVRYIDNTSGHYLPKGESARSSALAAFRKNGFDIPDDRYIDMVWDFKLKKWVPKND